MKIVGERRMGMIDPYPLITISVSLDDIEEIWIDEDTASDELLRPRLSGLFEKGVLKVIPGLKRTELDNKGCNDSTLAYIGKYMIDRELFYKMPLFRISFRDRLGGIFRKFFGK